MPPAGTRRPVQVRSRSDTASYALPDSATSLRKNLNKPEIMRGGKNTKASNPAGLNLHTTKRSSTTSLKPPGKKSTGHNCKTAGSTLRSCHKPCKDCKKKGKCPPAGKKLRTCGGKKK